MASTPQRRFVSALALFVSFGADAGQPTARIDNIQSLAEGAPGYLSPQYTHISNDGRAVAGYFADGFAGPQIPTAFHIEEGLGLELIQADIPGVNTSTIVTSMTPDGSVVTGTVREIGVPGTEIAFRWTRAHGMVLFNSPGTGFTRTSAAAISADGSLIVGWGINADGQRGFLWPSVGPVLVIDAPHSEATGVSANGTHVIGTYRPPGFSRRAFRWTDAGGSSIWATRRPTRSSNSGPGM